MADEVGLDRVTVSALAARLGVRQPSLYNHLTSLGGLVRDISVQSKRELGEVLMRACVGRAEADAITAMSHAYRGWALQHPGRYDAANRMPDPGDLEDEAVSLAAVQVVTDVLAGYRFEGDDAVDAVRLFRSTLHGFVSYEIAGAFRWSAPVDASFERLVHGMIAGFDQWRADAGRAASSDDPPHHRPRSRKQS